MDLSRPISVLSARGLEGRSSKLGQQAVSNYARGASRAFKWPVKRLSRKHGGEYTSNRMVRRDVGIGWEEVDEGKDLDDEEVAEEEFEALAAEWQRMIESGKDPMGVFLGGAAASQDRFPGGTPYMGENEMREALDTPYPFRPPPDVPKEERQAILRTSNLLYTLHHHIPRLFHALGNKNVYAQDEDRTGVVEQPATGSEEDKEDAQEQPWGGAGEEEEMRREQRDLLGAGAGGVTEEWMQGEQGTWVAAQAAELGRDHRTPCWRPKPLAEGSAGPELGSLSWTHDVFSPDVVVTNPIVSFRGPRRFQEYVSALRQVGARMKVRHLYSQSLADNLAERQIVVVWTLVLTGELSYWLGRWGLQDWWDEQLPMLLQVILASLPRPAREDERGVSGEGGQAVGPLLMRSPGKEPWFEEESVQEGPNTDGLEEETEAEEEELWEEARRELEKVLTAEERGEVAEVDLEAVGLCGETTFCLDVASGKVTRVDTTWFILDEPDGELVLARGQLFLHCLLLKEEELTTEGGGTMDK